jgi:two-component system, NarL family, nitrate/nitrite response regulator NarL
MTRVLIVDDHPIFRQGLALSVTESGDFQVCGEGASAEDAVALTQSLDPDIVLLDLSMPGGGLTALEAILHRSPDMRIIVLTASQDGDDLMRALRLGAKAYVVKGVGSGGLLDALRGVARGEGYVSPSLGARVLSESRFDANEPQTVERPHRTALLDQLTVREAEVLELVALGMVNKEIARHCAMQEKTVKHHMSRILLKLQVRNRTEAALVLRSEQPAQE